jgi:hypothetical protein
MAPELGLHFPERRRAARFPLAIPVELEGGAGVTRNVSLSGVLFRTEQAFSLGQQIRMVLVLERASPDRPVRLQCEGRVVRVARLDEARDVAVAISAYRFGASARPVDSA